MALPIPQYKNQRQQQKKYIPQGFEQVGSAAYDNMPILKPINPTMDNMPIYNMESKGRYDNMPIYGPGQMPQYPRQDRLQKDLQVPQSQYMQKYMPAKIQSAMAQGIVKIAQSQQSDFSSIIGDINSKIQQFRKLFNY